MALSGKGAIVIWNGITDEARAQFYDWHNHEHLPERLSIPGFLRGSRYGATTPATQPYFLTIYELADSGVAMSAPYLARLNAPTDWSRSTMLHFRSMIRALTDIERSEGAGPGGVMAAVRFEDSDLGTTALAAVRNSADVIAHISRMPRITGAHLCITDPGASATKTAESRHRNDSIVAPIGVVLIEGCDTAAVADGVAALLAKCALDPSTLIVGTYALEHTIRS
ncbi:MAG: hypothetical protein ABL904_20590 [Hyphomicrobiaceae bacterium]